MDVQKKLDDIVEAVGNARSMPMSASCVVNRAELLALLHEVRQALPDSLAQARELIGDREQMVEEARREAERIIQAAHSERGTLLSGTQLARQSQEEADRILAEARREAEEIRAEADDYVDSKLANFEVVLNKTIGSVDRGREKLLGRGPGAAGQDGADDDAPEYSADPQTLVRSADDYVDAKLGAFEAVLSQTLEAVGRGRQKLHGRIATDDLGAHMAAQESAGTVQHTSDADYLAGLAAADPGPQQGGRTPRIPAQAEPYPYEPAAARDRDAYAYPQDPYAGGYGQQQDHDRAYARESRGYGQGYVEDSRSHGGEYGQDSGGYSGGYGQDSGGYGGGYGQDAQRYDGGYGTRQQAGEGAVRPASLDETSFFDTSVIDTEQLRHHEQGR
ncbi:ATP synthase F0 subunit B [Streptomyces pacificus]|uniref:Cell division initiation protein n=1 Tax=Streptomyces pacificus TaxID=2705029 RepID=A0A6A0AS26_9ACTN|nr:cell division initiation protein [Streptomyces pacificus]GFH35508.1 cell division initiation protein [Streptomyces pacificus]